MNAKQLSMWKEIVQQCKSRAYSRINVASNVRSDTILAVDALVELVTPELAELLERLGRPFNTPPAMRTLNDRMSARTLATCIREALGR